MAERTRYNVVVPTAYGTMIVNRNDWQEHEGERFGVGWELMQSGRYAQGELDLLATLVRALPPAPVLLDIGANIGVVSLLFAELAGANGRVHAFEAQRIVYQMLMGNLALNSIENVYARHAALGAAAGTLSLPAVDYAQPRNFGGLRLGAAEAPGGTADMVPMVTLDSLGLDRVDFIKIDVEGMELGVLRGGLRTLERHRPPMQVEWLGDDRGSLPAFLIDTLGYRLYQAGMNLVCLPVERASAVPDGLPEITLDALQRAFTSS